MGVTISTHNRSSVARGHNIRKESIVSKEKHIDPNGVHEIWHDEHPRDAYKRIFGKAMEEYNAKQKRADRRIKDYYNTIREDKARKCVYEMIIGVYGKHEDGTSKCPRDIGYAIMKEFVDEWQIRNPNLELIGAYYHADEPDAEPHVHIDYVPKAHGYTNGMSVQNGLVKALGEMGFEKKGKATAQILWEKRENEYLESLCNRYGFVVEHPQVNKGVQHLHTSTYKAKIELENTRKSALDILKKHQEIESDYLHRKSEYDALQNSIARGKMQKEELEKELSERQARNNRIAEQTQQLIERHKAIEEASPQVKTIERVVEVPNYINTDYKELAEMYCHAFESMQEVASDKGILNTFDSALDKNDDYAIACNRMSKGLSL